MTASARRGPAWSRQLSDAPFVDTRFVHVPTTVVPPLDLTRLNDVGNAHDRQSLPRPLSTVVSGQKLLNDTSTSPPETNPMHMKLAATIAGGNTDLDPIQFTKHKTPPPLSSFQEPDLIHPKPPDVPVPRSKRDNHGVESKNESLSARLARLAAGGNSRRVVPMELV